MIFSLTLFRRTGLGFTLSHFPILGSGIGVYDGSLTLSFFNSNLINCDLLNYLRFFLSIDSLYGLVFKSLLRLFSFIVSLYDLVFESLLRLFSFIVSLYDLVFKTLLVKITFISIYIVGTHFFKPI